MKLVKGVVNLESHSKTRLAGPPSPFIMRELPKETESINDDLYMSKNISFSSVIGVADEISYDNASSYSHEPSVKGKQTDSSKMT